MNFVRRSHEHRALISLQACFLTCWCIADAVGLLAHRTHRMKPTLPVVLALVLGALLVWLALAWLFNALTLPVG
jgi:hypothetical protein